MSATVTLAVEGRADRAVLIRLLRLCGLEVDYVYGQRGKGELDRALSGYNEAAKAKPWVVVRDLNSDARCAPALVGVLLPDPAPFMRFRVAVREIEAWLLADREAIARFLQVSIGAVPGDPENIHDPKGLVVDLARRSRSRAIREDMVPDPGHSVQVGRAYTDRIIEFARRWDPVRARARSESLQRCIAALKTLVP